MNKVLVLGSNGHLGYNLTKLLLEKGYQVRAGVRSKNDEEKTRHLRALGAEIVEADLLNRGQLTEAMRGMDGVFQLAAVFNVTSKNPRSEVMEPTVKGAMNVVQAASDMNIKKLVFTSSIVAVGTIKDGEAPLDESSWNNKAIEPYAAAKTIAEQKAWTLAKELKLPMVTVLPATMIGPGFFRHTPSTLSFELLLKGKVPFALPLSFEFVDVRDVAKAHILAYENAQANGRYICSGTQLSLKELFAQVAKVEPGTKVPTREFPSALLGAVPFLDWLGNKLEGTPRFCSRELLKEYGRRVQKVSSNKIKKELGWKPMPIEESIADTVGWVKTRFA